MAGSSRRRSGGFRKGKEGQGNDRKVQLESGKDGWGIKWRNAFGRRRIPEGERGQI